MLKHQMGNMKDLLISVLMVNYNHEDTIRETINSVLNQTYENIQFIIIDDGSTDNSCKIINEFNDDRIELFKLEKNEHICYATNFGFSKVKGQLLARIDSDDIWYPTKLERQMKFMHENEECQVCFSWCDLIDENGCLINESEAGLFKLYQARFDSQEECLQRFYFKGNCLAQPSVLMKTEVMRNIGDFELTYKQLHDFDYWIRIAKCYKIYVIPERLIAVRRFRKDNKKNENASATNEANDTRVFNEYMDIREHFFDDMSEELFVSTFRKEFMCEDSCTPLELECEKAFLLCKPQDGWNGIPPAGIRKFKVLFRNEQAKNILEKKYHFTIKDLYILTQNHIYYDSLIRNKNENLINKLELLMDNISNENLILYKEIDFYKEEISRYRESTSWKITKPFRTIGKLLRRN